MTSLLTFLKGLWPWRRSRKPQRRRSVLSFEAPEIAASMTPEELAPPAQLLTPPEPEAAQSELSAADELEALVDPSAADEDAHDPNEEVFLEDQDDEAIEAAVSLTPIELAIERRRLDELEQLRAEAVKAALSGEHRIFLTETGGPGSLAEALNRLVQEGRVTARFEDDPENGAHILYRPAGADAAETDAAR